MKKHLVHILYDVPNWAYYYRAKALQKYAPEDFEVTIDNSYGQYLKSRKYDIIVQLAYSYAQQLRAHLIRGNYKTALISSYNVGWNYCNQYLESTIKYSDYVIINNFEMWDKSGRRPNTFHISNGVDLNIFKPLIPYESRKNRVLWIGSKGHSKTKNYQTILIQLQTELNRRGILCDFKCVSSTGSNRLTQKQMCDWYNTGTHYVVASSAEGTPNPALEAAACGLPVISTRVGNMPELIKDGWNGYLCDTNLKSLLNGILKSIERKKEMSDCMLNEIQEWGWEKRSQQYFDLFRKIIK